MSTLKKILAFAALLTLSTVALQAQGPGQTAFIDSFNSGVASTTVTANLFSGPTSASGFASDGTILGTERDMEVTATLGTTDIDLKGGTSSSFLLLSAGFGTKGTGDVVWDGVDGDGTVVDCATGLGGVDLTALGSGDRLRLKEALSDTATGVTLTVFSSCADFSSLTMGLAANFSVTNFDFLFGSFVVGGGAGASFTSVNAIVLSIDATMDTATDFSTDFVTTPVELVSFTASAEVE